MRVSTFVVFLLVSFPVSCIDFGFGCSDQSSPSGIRESILVYIGETVKLNCRPCFPHLNFGNLIVTWYYRREIEAEDEELVGMSNQSLRLLDLREEKSGLYWCRWVIAEGVTYISSVYEVSVTGNTATRNFLYRLSENSANSCSQASAINSRSSQEETKVNLHGQAGKVFTKWSQWSSCSVPFCKLGDVCGYRRRIGTCYVHFDGMKDVEIGRPCRSKFLPAELAQFAKNRLDEIEYELCVAYRCIVDSKQPNLQSASQQFFKLDGSDSQSKRKGHKIGISEVIKAVMRGTQLQIKFPKASQRLTIACGESLSRFKSVVWLRRRKIIEPLLHSTKIDVLNRLVFDKIREDDTDIYSCWEEEALVGIYVVFVLESFDYESAVNQVLVYLVSAITLIFLVRIAFFPWQRLWQLLRYSQY